jgi:hypothetical protein
MSLDQLFLGVLGRNKGDVEVSEEGGEDGRKREEGRKRGKEESDGRKKAMEGRQSVGSPIGAWKEQKVSNGFMQQP